MNYSEIKLQGLDKDGNENEYTLADFKGQKVVLYFILKIIHQAARKRLVILEII